MADRADSVAAADALTEAAVPERLRNLFWDCDPAALDWPSHAEFIIGRVLRQGGWDAMTWLRDRAGDERIRTWIEERQARGLSPRRLRYWELILDLPADRVAAWMSRTRAGTWERRHHS